MRPLATLDPWGGRPSGSFGRRHRADTLSRRCVRVPRPADRCSDRKRENYSRDRLCPVSFWPDPCTAGTFRWAPDRVVAVSGAAAAAAAAATVCARASRPAAQFDGQHRR